MDNSPQTSAIILQIVASFLSTLITGLTITYFGFKLNQKKLIEDKKSQIIKAAAHEISTYSGKTKSSKENKDLIDYIIYKIPNKTNEITNDLNLLMARKDSIYPKLRHLTLINLCALLLETIFLYYFNLSNIQSLAVVIITSLILLVTIILMVRATIPFLRDVKKVKKKYQLLMEDLGNIKGSRNINSITRYELTEFIIQRNKLGIGTSTSNIQDEMEMYGIKVTDAEIIRSHLNLIYPDAEQRRDILSIYYMDGKPHESFDELSEQDVLKFIDTVQKNAGLLNTQSNK